MSDGISVGISGANSERFREEWIAPIASLEIVGVPVWITSLEIVGVPVCGCGWMRAAGSARDLIALAERLGQRWLKGIRLAVELS